MTPRVLSLSLIPLAIASLAAADESKPSSLLPANARVAIIGDSITEQKIYSKFIEAYLLACTGRTDIKCFQFGWGGETASGFSQRLENDLSAFHPTVATLCYGMNDGHYIPYVPGIGAEYEKYMRLVITGLQKVGVKDIVAGSPGAVDTFYFKKASATPDQYNDNLGHLRDIDKKLATEYHAAFADVHAALEDAMTKAKKALGPEYDVCGRDGVHPQANGHLIMAEAYLKALGCDGAIGEITVDMTGASKGSAHHTTTGSKGVAEVESSVWPFCFDADTKASNSNRSILPYSDFNQALNRVILRVEHLNASKAKVTWGTETREFTAEQLSQGINLAAEFSKTPFDGAFAKFSHAVDAKQAYETGMIKGLITNFRLVASDAKADPELAGALDVIKRKSGQKQASLDEAERKELTPVKHKIVVEALQ